MDEPWAYLPLDTWLQKRLAALIICQFEHEAERTFQASPALVSTKTVRDRFGKDSGSAISFALALSLKLKEANNVAVNLQKRQANVRL